MRSSTCERVKRETSRHRDTERERERESHRDRDIERRELGWGGCKTCVCQMK